LQPVDQAVKLLSIAIFFHVVNVNWEENTRRMASKRATHPNLQTFPAMSKTEHIVVLDGSMLT
jgi:hypothetical protein